MPSKTKPSLPLGEKFTDPDLIDRVFDYVVELMPEISLPRLDAMKTAVRSEFAGQQHYIAQRQPRQQLVACVLKYFDGRNASEVARQLNISRASVYRYLKQPGNK